MLVDKFGVSSVIKAALNHSQDDTIKEWGENKIRRHRTEHIFLRYQIFAFCEPAKVAVTIQTKNLEHSPVQFQPVADAQTMLTVAARLI